MLVGSPDSLRAGAAPRLRAFLRPRRQRARARRRMAMSRRRRRSPARVRSAGTRCSSRSACSVRSDMVYDLWPTRSIPVRASGGMQVLRAVSVLRPGAKHREVRRQSGSSAECLLAWASSIDTTPGGTMGDHAAVGVEPRRGRVDEQRRRSSPTANFRRPTWRPRVWPSRSRRRTAGDSAGARAGHVVGDVVSRLISSRSTRRKIWSSS